MRDVIVVIPGITGAVLQKDGKDIWNSSGGAVINSLVTLGESLHALKLDGDSADVDDLGDGITAPRVIRDLHMVPGLWKIDGYMAILRFINDSFDVMPGHNLFEFPYDWRRDNRVAARRLARNGREWLNAWRVSSGAFDAKLILIAHSMGGHICRYFLECLDGWRDTRLLVTFGTPYRGSVIALKFLVAGIRKLEWLGDIDALRSFPSIHQLLPTYAAYDRGEGNLVRVDETNIPHIDPERAKAALSFHGEIQSTVDEHLKEEAYTRERYEIAPIVGISQPTLLSARRSDQTVEFLEQYRGEQLDGDGSVPRFSATPFEIDESSAIFAADRHASLQNNETILRALEATMSGLDINYWSTSATGIGSSLQLALEDAFATHEPIAFRVRSVDPKARLTAVVVDVETGAETARLQLGAGEGWRQAEIDPLPLGSYRLAVFGESLVEPVADVFMVLPHFPAVVYERVLGPERAFDYTFDFGEAFPYVSTPPVTGGEPRPVTEKHINAWIAGRSGRPRRAQLQSGNSYELKLNAGEPVDAGLLRGDTKIDTSGLPEEGLMTEWLLTSRSVRLEAAPGEPVEAARTGTRAGWMARFELHIPKYADSETRTVLVTPHRRSSGRIDLVITAGGEIYRELVIGLDVASPRRRRRRAAAGIDRELVHTPAAHLALQPSHEWTTPPGYLTIDVHKPNARVRGSAGVLSISPQPTQWFGSPAAVANPIESVQDAAERFRATWEGYLNALDADELAGRLEKWSPIWWGSRPNADRAHIGAWEEVSRSRELREFAAEGRLLYDTVFPPGTELRGWLDLLEPGHRLDVSWLDVDEGWVPHMPWGLMYAGDVPPAGEPIDPTRFLALHLRIGYTSHFVPVASKALGNPSTTYCGNFLYWGTGESDLVAGEAARQRAELSSWEGQLIWPSVASADPKAELLDALEAPSPPPVGVLYFFCQSSYGARRDDPVLGFASPIGDTSALRRTELGMRMLDERPLVFANACTSGVSDPYFANDLEQRFFRRGARAFLGTETKVPIEFASRFARIFFHLFYRQADHAPMAAGEAVAQTRLFLWHHYCNIGGIFYTHVNQYELFMADDAEVRALRA